jgi:hypothetical protein
VLFSNREAPVNIIQVVGGRNGLSGTMQNASNAVSVMYFVRKDAYSRAKMVFSKQIWITAKGAVFVLMNAGPGR